MHVLEGNQFFSAELGATVIHGLINEKLQAPKDPQELLSEREVEILYSFVNNLLPTKSPHNFSSLPLQSKDTAKIFWIKPILKIL